MHGFCRFGGMKIKGILTTALLLTGACAYSQTADGNVNVTFDKGVEGAINGYFSRTKEEKTKGYRIQLCSESGNNSKNVANSTKASFLRLYPDVPAYLTWDTPNFKVKVGDFKNRLDATLFWKQLVIIFPASYVVMDEINPYRIKE